MRKKAVAVLCAVGILSLAAFAVWQVNRQAAVIRTVESFVAAVASGDVELAADLSAGAVAWRAKSIEQFAKVVEIQAAVLDMGRGWAQARAFVELVLQDGSHDAGWYRLELVNEGEWKIVSVSETVPWPSGLWGSVGEKEVQEAKSVFASYLESLIQNRYQEAGRYLCGPARRAHERSAPVLAVAPLLEQAGEVSLAPVWRKGGQMICRVCYEADGQKMNALVRFVRLGDGWHILSITQLGSY